MSEEIEDYVFPEFQELNFVYENIALDIFLALRVPEWHRGAICITPDGSLVDTFYPDSNAGHGYNHLVAPRKMCLVCPVRYKCLKDGIDEPFGVWGGHSPSQRRRISSLMKKGSTLEEASQSIDLRSRDAR